jgi:hypothetical protein
MFVPAAVLIGREVDAAMLGRGVDSAALAVGLIAVLAVSPDYSIVAQSGSVLTEGTVLAVGVVLVAWSGPLREALTSSLPPRLYRGFVRLAPALVTLVVLVAMIGVPPTTGGSGEQQAFAAELDRTAPASATVFVQRGLGTPFHTFSFYAQRPLESGTLAEFRESDTSYAIVESTAVSTVDAETTVLMRATVASGRSVSLIEVER